MCRSQAKILTSKELAANYVHAGMIGLDGEKMSKSLGNLVLVSTLVARGVDPMAIRLALMGDHYRIDRMWSDEILARAESSMMRLRQALSLDTVANTDEVEQSIINALADDLNTGEVVKAIEAWVAATLRGAYGGDKKGFVDYLDALLGLKL
jgi:L-cysteine:1D-myo-inositol 2-amino-2-deoxy-alpha-D-glucopyranoside ligase